MMELLYGALLLVAGLLVGVRLLASLYRVIDLWYTIRTVWAAVLGRILVWLGVTGGVLLLLEGNMRWAFVAGMGLHGVLHLLASLVLAWTGVRQTSPTPIVE
jgi:hypothetical protein